MTRFQGFKTKEEAKDFMRIHRGFLCWDKRTPKANKLTACGREYWDCVNFGGLDYEKFPYAVYWRESQDGPILDDEIETV